MRVYAAPGPATISGRDGAVAISAASFRQRGATMARTRKQAGALNGNAAVTTQPGLAPVPVNGATYSSSTYPGTSYPETPYTVDYAEVAMIAGLGADAGIQRRPVGGVGWGMALRRFARAPVWAIPAAMICLALAGVWGWPTADGSPSGASPGTWL